jgi:photosystem II stability/assembly factor-like uncharacterized protein
MMFKHLDDPSPPSPSLGMLTRILGRAAVLRGRRARSAFGVAAVITLAVGVVIGMFVPRSGAGPAYTAFTSQRGVLPTGTPVPQSDLADVVFVDRAHGFALALHGEQSILANSDDGGATWRVVDGALPIGFPAQLEFADTTHGYLWGGAPAASGGLPLWTTDDGGLTWVTPTVGPVVSDVSAIGADAWAVVGTCAISSSSVAPPCPVALQQSGDNGVTWRPSATPPPLVENAGLSISDQDIELARITHVRAYVLSFVSSGAGLGSGAGQLVYTGDGGQSWQTRTDPCPAYFRFGEQIAASGTEDLWVLCASQASTGSQAKALYRSSDGGQTWRLSAAANAPVLSGNVTLPTAPSASAQPAQSSTSQSGASSPSQPAEPSTTPPSSPAPATGTLPTDGYVSPYSLGHDNFAVVSPDDAWLFPDRNGVFGTHDGGGTWTLVAGLDRAGLVVGGSGNVVFVDATHGWVCETGAGLWRTTDGVSWKRLGS